MFAYADDVAVVCNCLVHVRNALELTEKWSDLNRSEERRVGKEC